MNIDESTMDHQELYSYYFSIFNTVGVGIIHLTREGIALKFNNYCINELFSGLNPTNENILNLFTKNGSPFYLDNIESIINKDLELVFTPSSGNPRSMGARLTIFQHPVFQESLLLSLKDLQEIRSKDDEIKELQNQLVSTAYRDGVAENAVSVLHNIGNILTTIIGKISNETMLQDIALTTSVLNKIASTCCSLQTKDDFINFFNSDPKALAIPMLIKEIAKNSIRTEEQVNEIFTSVKEKCMNIAAVISAQQKYANFKEKETEEVYPHRVINDCILMNKDNITKREINIEVTDFPVSAILMEKVGFSQVVLNAITNSIEAIDERYARDPYYSEKIIHISGEIADKYLIIKIQDNGIGISSETFSKLFKFGFSTKGRSSGFGLHNAANYMNSNGGKMELKSSGIGTGAVTLLYCPVSPKENIHEKKI